MGRKISCRRGMTAGFCALALISAPVSAQDSAHPLLDELVAKAEAGDPQADPAAYHAGFVAALEEARRHYADDSPYIAQRKAGVATGLAALNRLDEASALVESVLPTLEAAQPEFRKGLLDALSLRGYIAVFKADHAQAVVTFERGLQLQREASGGRPDVELARALANLAASYREAGRPGDALERNAEALAMAAQLDPPPADGAMWYANRAVYLRELGRDDEAVATAYEGLEYAERILPPGHPLLANLYANLAMLQVRQGRPNAAIPLARQAFELIEGAAGSPNQNSATMRAIFATALVQAGRFEEGLAFLEQAMPIVETELGPESNRALQVREAYARALLRTGRLDEALRVQREVVTVRDARLAATHVGRMEARMILATIELERGDPAAAAATLGEGVALRAAAMPATHPDLLSEKALLLLARSRARLVPADVLATEAEALIEQLKAEAGRSATGALSVPLRSAFGFVAEVLSAAGKVERAFEAQQWSARTSVDDAAIAAALARAEQAPGAAQAFAGRRQLLIDRASELRAIEGQLANPQEGFDFAAANARIGELDRAIAAQEGVLASAGSPVPRFAAARTDDVRDRLSRGDVFLQASEMRDGYLVTVVAQGALTQILVNERDFDIRALASRMRQSLEPTAGVDFDRAAAAQLYAALFGSDAGGMLQDAKRLRVSANGALGAVPFAALVPDMASENFLIDRLAVARLPGAPRGASADGGRPEPALLALGDVGGLKGGTEAALRGGMAIDLAALPDLPQAADELAELARVLGVREPLILTGEAATEAAFRKARVVPGSVVAFATHGLVSGEVEGLREPALLLSAEGADDGLLTASEIARLDLPARWVVLSACNTAAAAGPDAPGLSGLAQSFIMAGADRILATHWPVRDDMARRITTGTLEAAARGAEPADALRASMIAARSSGLPGAGQPSLWAAFELVE
jgi:CHAT domain-containing protein